MIAFFPISPFLYFLSFCFLYWSWKQRAKRRIESHHPQSHLPKAKGKQNDDEIELHRIDPTKVKQKEEIAIHGTLTQEMITDILIRLPVKSIIRFNALSKGFSNLFRSPNFIPEHLHFSNQFLYLFLHVIHKEDYNYRKRSSFTLRLFPCASPSLIGSLSKITLPTEQPFPIVDHEIQIEGSSSGLLCLTTKKLILIWNPATRQVKRLPRPSSTVTSSTCFSIGFASVANDYKVVLIQGEITEGFEVYSLKTGAWTQFDVAASSLQLHDGSVCSYYIHKSFTTNGLVTTNGSCFGVVTEAKRESEADERLDFGTRLEKKLAPSPEWIICFDLGTETFSKINMPYVPPLDQRILAPYKDSIALLVNPEPVRHTIDLWVHTKGEDCLTKLYSVTLDRLEFLVGLWRDEVLITKRESNEKALFYTYNGEENKILATIEFQLKFSFASACDYVESLVLI